MTLDRLKTLERRPGLAAIDPHQVGEDHGRILPAALPPGTEAQTVEGPEERAIVDQAAREHAGEVLGQGALPYPDGHVVEVEGRLGSLVVEGHVAQMDPRIDAALVLSQ